MVLVLAAAYLGCSVGTADAQPIASTYFGHKCVNVIDFGADPSGGSTSQTTKAFREAFLSAGLASGSAVCAPAGTYRINGDITLYSGARSGNGGISFFGAGPGLTVLVAVGGQTQYVFDSCPDFSGVNPNMPFTVPTVCPSAPAYPGTPAPGAAISGVTFANFTIFAEPPGAGTAGPSGFYFPKVNGLLIDNVCFRGSPYSIFDFGERLANSFSGIEIRDSTCQTDFLGHYIALHGGGSGLTVERNGVRGSQTNPNFGSGVLFDTSDVVGQTVSQVSFRYNDLEGVFLGNFLFLPAPTGSAATLIDNAEWIGNIYDHCAFACYYFGAQTSGSPVPTLSNIRLSDRWAISDYSSVILDGGSNSLPGTGIGGVKIGGPALYGSDNSRQVYPMGLLSRAAGQSSC